MRGKLLFVTGALAGYVLGARAGRQRYEQIKAAANDLWNAPPVQRRVSEVRDFTLEAVGDAPAALFGTAKKALTSMVEKRRSQADKARTSTPSQTTTVPASVPATEPAFGTD